MINFADIRSWFGYKSYQGYSHERVGSKDAIWISDGNYHKMYENIPELHIAVNRKVDMLISGKFIVLDEDGNNVYDPVLDLLRSPNPLQGRNDFLAQGFLNMELTGNSFVKKVEGSLKALPNAIYQLPSRDMSIEPSGKLFDQIDKNEIINRYTLSTPDGQVYYLPNEILHTKVSGDPNYFAAESPIKAIIKPLSNIQESYKSRNIIIGDMGAFGILSFGGAKDAAGALPVGDNPERIEKQYREKYGNEQHKSKILISRVPAEWTPMSYPMKDLMLHEEVAEDFIKIVENVGLNINMFSSVEGSTYENVLQSEKGAYQNTIIPQANLYAAKLGSFLGLTEKGLRLRMDYNHLPLLQDDEKSKAEARKIKIENVLALLDRELISLEEAQAELTDGKEEK